MSHIHCISFLVHWMIAGHQRWCTICVLVHSLHGHVSQWHEKNRCMWQACMPRKHQLLLSKPCNIVFFIIWFIYSRARLFTQWQRFHLHVMYNAIPVPYGHISWHYAYMELSTVTVSLWLYRIHNSIRHSLLSCVSGPQQQGWRRSLRQRNVIILMKFPSLGALEVVIQATFSTANDKNFIKMATASFHFGCPWCYSHFWKPNVTTKPGKKEKYFLYPFNPKYWY